MLLHDADIARPSNADHPARNPHLALDGPGEQYDYTVSKKKALRPGETLSYEATETVTADHPEGDYTLTVDAAPKKGENVSASATLTVY